MLLLEQWARAAGTLPREEVRFAAALHSGIIRTDSPHCDTSVRDGHPESEPIDQIEGVRCDAVDRDEKERRSVMQNPDLFVELVRSALTEWTSDVVERLKTDKDLATQLQTRWLELIDVVKHDRQLPDEAQLNTNDLRLLLVLAVNETSGFPARVVRDRLVQTGFH